MSVLRLLMFYFIIKGSFCQFMSDVTREKLYTQFVGVVNYMFRMEESRPIQSDVAFNLYTKRNLQIPQILVHDHPALLKMSYFDSRLKTYFIIHGFTDHKDREIIAKLRSVINAVEVANIIVVDWRRLAGLIYFNAADSALLVGNYLGQFLLFLERNSVDLNNVHLIGHSLGAQISGIAGAVVNGRLSRITGLDPAGPYFEFIYVRNSTESLDKTDAQFVDVIHTNGEEFGVMKPIGDADFYPNNGVSPQPGCTDILTVVSCSHIRSVDFYTESVTAKIPFAARHCKVERDGPECLNEEPVYMGHHLSTTARGVYYLETNARPPFAKGVHH